MSTRQNIFSNGNVEDLMGWRGRVGLILPSSTIIMEPWFSRSIPDLLLRETGVKVLVLPPSVGGIEGVKTYFDLFDYLIGQLSAALSQGA